MKDQRSWWSVGKLVVAGVLVGTCAWGGFSHGEEEPWPPLLNPNQASAAALAALPGLGEAAAKKIVEGRPFLSMGELYQALGISLDATALDELGRHMFIPIDLNSASREEILAIPGVGKRMAHEFEEYRPYLAMAQFRREIGKYVDDREVARLERYVTIR